MCKNSLPPPPQPKKGILKSTQWTRRRTAQEKKVLEATDSTRPNTTIICDSLNRCRALIIVMNMIRAYRLRNASCHVNKKSTASRGMARNSRRRGIRSIATRADGTVWGFRFVEVEWDDRGEVSTMIHKNATGSNQNYVDIVLYTKYCIHSRQQYLCFASTAVVVANDCSCESSCRRHLNFDCCCFFWPDYNF